MVKMRRSGSLPVGRRSIQLRPWRFDTTDDGTNVQKSYENVLRFAEIDEDTSNTKSYKK